jgi:hypothetical protein
MSWADGGPEAPPARDPRPYALPWYALPFHSDVELLAVMGELTLGADAEEADQ